MIRSILKKNTGGQNAIPAIFLITVFIKDAMSDLSKGMVIILTWIRHVRLETKIILYDEGV